MVIADRKRRILRGILLGIALVSIPWLAFPFPSDAVGSLSYFLLIMAGILEIGVCIVGLGTYIWLRSLPSFNLTLIVPLMISFTTSVYFTILDRASFQSYTLVKFLAFIFGAYLLLVFWAFFSNAVDKPSKRSQAMLGGAMANFLISFVIIISLDNLGVQNIDLLLFIFFSAIVSGSLAWSSLLEILGVESSSTNWIKMRSAIMASFFTILAPLLMIVYVVMTTTLS